MRQSPPHLRVNDMKWIRRLTYLLLVLAALVAAAFIFGPREPKDTTVTLDVSQIAADPVAYLAKSEQAVGGIREGLEKEIVWAYPESRAKTPLAFVYVHGFSASRMETHPLTETVSREFGANVFYTRLTGHGRDGAAMTDGSVAAWVNDIAEAVAVGRAIGERVVIISVSTGSSLAAWAASRPELMEGVAGHVMISPNFALRAKGAGILSLPFAGEIADLVMGKQRSFETRNDMHAQWWTSAYPTRALLPMKAAVDIAAGLRYSAISLPCLFIYSSKDSVVDPAATERVASLWGGRSETMVVDNSDDPSNHVIAGDALSPSTTAAVAARIVEFVKGL